MQKRNVVCLSGGKASFWCANYAINKYGRENVLLYFNNTFWEHEDLYRFLGDISLFLNMDIFSDSDGRSPEQVFFDEHLLGNNRLPICSSILKAKRLQAFYSDGDNLIFGIGCEERHRAERLRGVYQVMSVKLKKNCTLEFPLIENDVNSFALSEWFFSTGVKTPKLYELGFSHNNCSGGCVRAGKKQWALLYKVLPGVYAEREKTESDFSEMMGGNYTYMKGISLKEYRVILEANKDTKIEDDGDSSGECIGVCQFLS